MGKRLTWYTHLAQKNCFNGKIFYACLKEPITFPTPKNTLLFKKFVIPTHKKNNFSNKKNFNTHLKETVFYLKKKNYYACLKKWSPKQKSSHTCLKNVFSSYFREKFRVLLFKCILNTAVLFQQIVLAKNDIKTLFVKQFNFSIFDNAIFYTQLAFFSSSGSFLSHFRPYRCLLFFSSSERSWYFSRYLTNEVLDICIY